ncbi:MULTISPECIES: Gfo/Idh/MocA family protein [unclassified Caulobacter]|uniref:Gfo/Idh/MocA family protein n=1 Tax=unclassified Caulobacter TaxID=2648921 RepID=UPI0006F21F3C|nr:MULTISPECIES: Gfo/Idh/MocA family oxidoreductase [unclassified Caulobacter]KQV58755.1 galactose 1-dehydrogenase [Caulobacter sp. Root342]KQV68736.1 galactose 1-dehydrogenase [Caulobacter sp. Root343]
MIRIGLVGVGKIAHDQHIPALAADPRFSLVAAASRSKPDLGGIPVYHDIDEMLARGPELDAVALCTPPQARRETALAALRAGKHVFLEKPPGATVSEVAELAAVARDHGVVLFTSWHSRFAAGVPQAKAWLATRAVRKLAIEWREDVRRWHPGQTWIWQAGGMGVFDPAINALSILTEIMPAEVFVTDARLRVPENVQSPIAAHVDMTTLGGTEITADLDFLQTGPQTWDITAWTDDGVLKLSLGGAKLEIDEALVVDGENREYPGLYDRFAALVAEGRSEVDVRPLTLVADAFLVGTREVVEAFIE